MSETQPRPSPFRGPRPFKAGETLYGRDYEARALLSTLIAERIVLLHSPSGAGKTSLIQAALIPMLEEREFVVLPMVRVGQEPPAGWAGNRYLGAALLSLEEGRPPDEQLPLAELAGLSLAAYLAGRIPAGAEQDTVLVVDQFEEVLTRDPTDTAAKRAFFRELGDALRRPRLWALLVIREEYVAALEPYTRLVPTRLATHFRLELLGVEGALAALREPPRQLGVAFPEELAVRLVDDLRRVNVQQADGTITQQLGPSVEPVQLQVVGLRLWEGLPSDATAISAAGLAALGDVGSALGDYYASQVAAVAATTGVGERVLRGWFERELITPQGVRGQVLQGQEASAGLANEAIRRLVDAYLVRAEPRRGATWYELAHDRLIAPVRAGNAAWFAANLSTLQRQAELWAQQGRPAGLLLRGEALAEAEGWAAANSGAVTDDERELLARSREGERQARRLRTLAIGATVLAVCATLAFVTALWFFNRAEEQRREAERQAALNRARELAAAAVSSLPVDPQRSLLLGLASVETTRAAGEAVTPEARQALHQAVHAARAERDLLGHTAGLRKVAYSPAGDLISTVGVDGAVRLWDADGTKSAVLEGHADEVYAAVFSPNGATLATGGFEGEVIIWDLAALAEVRRLPVGETSIFDLAYSPDGALLAAVTEDGVVTIWDSDGAEPRLRFTPAPDTLLAAVAISPDGSRIAVGGEDSLVRVWDLAALLETKGELQPALNLEGARDTITDIAFSPDGARIAASSRELRVLVWDATDATLLAALQGHAGSVYGVAFSPDGGLLVTGSSDGTAKVWRLDSGQLLLTLAGHTDFVYSVALSPDGRRLATASLDSSARLWSLAFAPPDGASALATNPAGDLLATFGQAELRLWKPGNGEPLAVVPGPESGFSALAFSPDGASLALGDFGGVIKVFAVAALLADPDAAPLLELSRHEDAVGRLAFSPDGGRLASASDDTTVRLWDAVTGDELLLLDELAGEVYGLAFSSDGARLAAGDQDGNLRVWVAADGAEVTALTVGAPINTLAYSADGATLAAGADDGQIYRYDADGAPRAALRHGGLVNTLIYRPDGTLLAAGNDGRITTWGDDGAPGEVLPAPAAAFALAPLPGERVATVSGGQVLIFDLRFEELEARARAHLIRGPSEAECATYRLVDGCR